MRVRAGWIPPQGRAFQRTAEEAMASPDIVASIFLFVILLIMLYVMLLISMILVNSLPALVLFYLGAGRSFVS